MPLLTDMWRVGLAAASAQAIAARGGLEGLSVRWLPPGPPFTFLADPFGLWRDGTLHLFVEAYDYRTRHGVIDLVTFEGDAVRRETVLREPWHLSYPFVFEAEGAVYMAPEAHRSGACTLYRAVDFPRRWEPVLRLELDAAAIDPTLFRHGGLWWLAYSPTGPQSYKQGRLHLAFAERLAGPWRTHRGNPVREDRSSSRPGGAPFVHQGALTLPVQDCVATYGAAIRLLTIRELTPERFAAEASAPIGPPASAAPFCDGLHTFSPCGELTLVDVKRTDRGPGGVAIAAGRALGRWRRGSPAGP
jgi:hypothetical protein